jgi:hypothetical protein
MSIPMEEQKSTLLKSAMNGGLITGGVLIVYSLILYMLNLSISQTANYLSIIVLGAILYMLAKNYRDKDLQGIIPYGNALGYSVLIGFFASVLLAFFIFLELKFLDPGLIEKQLEIVRQKYIEAGMSEDMIEKSISMAKKFMTPVFSAIFTILAFTFYAFIVSLITSIFIKKENKIS